MSEPFLGEIKLVSFNYAPRGWALCNGQLLPINQNQALFALFGTTYGGDGRVNFALPDLRGRTPNHFGNGFIQGQKAGTESHTLTLREMPAHTHQMRGASGDPNTAAGYLPSSTTNPYGSGTPGLMLNPTAISSVGGSQSHPNMQPYLVLNFIVALQGTFPSQN